MLKIEHEDIKSRRSLASARVSNADARLVHAFSVELSSKRYLKTLSLGNGTGKGVGRIVFEGSLGRLRGMKVVEDSLLEISGSGGTFRIDIDRQEMRRMLKGEL